VRLSLTLRDQIRAELHATRNDRPGVVEDRTYDGWSLFLTATLYEIIWSGPDVKRTSTIL